MRTKLLAIFASLFLMLTLAGCTTSEKKDAGMIIGGVAGGALGHGLTGGSAAGTIGGTLAGGYIGRKVAN